MNNKVPDVQARLNETSKPPPVLAQPAAQATIPAPQPPQTTPVQSNDTTKPVLIDQRLENPSFRGGLENMAREAGWMQVGGKLVRTGDGANAEEAEYRPGQVGEVTGRTAWVPNAPWFPAIQRDAGLEGNKDGKATETAVRKALSGEKMGIREQRHVKALLDWMEGEMKDAAEQGASNFDPFSLSEDIAAVGDAEPSMVDDALVSQAITMDETAVETAAKQFENDDAAFMARVKEIINGNQPAATTADSRATPDGGRAPATGPAPAERPASEPTKSEPAERKTQREVTPLELTAQPVETKSAEAAPPESFKLASEQRTDEQEQADADTSAKTEVTTKQQSLLPASEAVRAKDDARAAKVRAAPEPGGLFAERKREFEAKKAEESKAERTAPVSDGVIEDVGEKIGAARKDTADRGYTLGGKNAATDDERPTWAKRFEVSQVAKSSTPGEEGRWIISDKKNTDFMGRPRQIGNTFATKEEAESFMPMAAVAIKHRVRSTDGGKYEIWRIISDRKSVKVVEKSFDSREAATEYMARNAVEIIETNTTFGEADLPQAPDRKRVGTERRKGNVKGEDFMRAFGLRAVEFGNWNNQAERQALMNDAYDGLMDLADVLGAPATALGLNGDLALAFGARGHGLSSARAHYERHRAVINLTKENGAGSLAHEWFHAVDAYLGRQDGKASSQWEIEGDGTRTLKSEGPEDYATHGFRVRDSGVREEVRKAYETLVNTIFKKGTTYVEDATKADDFAGRARTDLQQELDKLRAELAAQKDATYWKRNNQPASAKLLAEFDAIAKRMLEGEAQALATDWRKIEGMKSRIAARWTNDSLERLNTIYKEVRGRSGFDSQNQGGLMDRLRGYMNRYSQRLKMLADAQTGTEKTRMVPTEFAMNAKELDQGRGGEYWTTPHEMAARAFQGYVEDKISEAGNVSRFLNYAPENGGILTPWGVKFPYPRGAERKAINAALDKFVGALKTKETDKGTALFSQADADQPGVSMKAVQDIADAITARLPRAPMVLVYESPAQLSEDVRGDANERTEGMFKDGTLYLFANAISSEPRAAWVVLHELKHAGLARAYGPRLNAALHAAAQNTFIDRLARAIVTDRKSDLSRADSINEAIAELAAAIHTGDFDAIKSRYGVAVPVAFRGGIEGAIARFVEKVRTILNDLLGRRDAFSNDDIRTMLRESNEALGSREVIAGDVAPTPAYASTKETEDGKEDRVQAPDGNNAIERVRAYYGSGEDRSGRLAAGLRKRRTEAVRSAEEARSLTSRGLLKQRGGRAGFCNEYAAKAAVDGLGDMVIGRTGSGLNQRIWHAVVRLSDGAIYDPTLGYYFEPGVYEEVNGFVPVKTLTSDEIIAFGVKTGFVPSAEKLDLDVPDDAYEQGLDPQESRAPIFSQAQVRNGEFAVLSDAQQRAMRNVGGIVDPIPFREQIKSWRTDLGKKLTQGIADQFRPVKDLDQHAYILNRLSKGTDGAVEALMMFGNLRLIDGVYDSDASGVGVIDVMKKLQGEQNRFLWWIAANRAESLKVEDREHLFSDEDIRALKTMNQGQMPDGSSRAMTYSSALAEYNRVSANVLDMAEQSGTIDAESRRIWEKEFYVPFYRAMEDGISGPNIARKSGLVRQYAFKKLKGGADKINQDLMANVMMNWAHLISSAAKNRGAEASLVAAERAGVATRIEEEQKGAVFFLKNGQKEWYTVEDPYILEAVSALEYNGLTGPTVELMAKFKRALTIGVTASPVFKIRNLMRDSLSAIATAPLSYNPLKNVGAGVSIMREKRGQEYASLLASGGIIRFGTMLEGNRSSNLQRLINAGVDRDTVVSSWDQIKDKIQAALDKYNNLGDISEGANRAALYRKLKAEGKSHAEAAFAARDILDFSMGGTYGAVRFLTTVVPFANARIQGLYKLGRAAKKEPRRFAAVTGATALASIALMLAYEEDDDWKKREDWDRDNNWWFKIDGVAYRIPKPFEVGAIGTLAERGVELFASDEMTGERFMQRLGAMVGNTFALNPVPQMFKPLVDVYANVDSFTGRPIEKMSMERLAKSQRYDGRTSEVARFLGLAGDYTGLSPAQADHMIRAYFGWLGTAVTTAVDFGVKRALDRPAEPAMQLRDIFILGSFAEELPTGSSRYVTMFYEQSREIEEAYATWRQKLKEGDTDGAAEYREDNERLIAQRQRFARAKRRLSDINARVRAIENDYRLSPDTKRAKIDALRSRSDDIAQRFSGPV